MRYVASLWREVRKTLPVQGIGGEFFPGDAEHWERRLTAWNRDFHHLCEQAKITDLRFHDLRGDFGVRFLRANVTHESDAHRRNYLFRIATNLVRDIRRRPIATTR